MKEISKDRQKVSHFTLKGKGSECPKVPSVLRKASDTSFTEARHWAETKEAPLPMV